MALHHINMKGDIKEVQEHLAFDTSLQKQMNFFPCDKDGEPVAQVSKEQVEQVKKKDVAHVESDTIKDYPVEITIPAGVELVNPLEEELHVIREEHNIGEQTITQTVEKKKRGRKASKQN